MVNNTVPWGLLLGTYERPSSSCIKNPTEDVAKRQNWFRNTDKEEDSLHDRIKGVLKNYTLS